MQIDQLMKSYRARRIQLATSTAKLEPPTETARRALENCWWRFDDFILMATTEGYGRPSLEAAVIERVRVRLWTLEPDDAALAALKDVAALMRIHAPCSPFWLRLLPLLGSSAKETDQ